MTTLLAALIIGQSPELVINDADLMAALTAYGQKIADGSVPSNNADLQSELTRASAKATFPAPKQLVKKESDLYAAAGKATVVFTSFGKCPDCGQYHPAPASGFIVSPDGLVVTNYHVVANATASAFGVMTPDKKIYQVTEILAANKTTDVALVRINGKNLPYLPIRKSANPGDTVFVLSHPRNSFYYMSKGSVSRYSMENNTPWLEITADYAVGSSGGPVFDSEGEVVGIVSMTNSVYSGQPRTSDLQMVRKICVPSQAILNLVAK